MVNKTEYFGEFVQALVIGTIFAVGVFAIMTIGNINVGQDPSFVTIIVMFLIGTISVWWALYKMKGKSFLGLGPR